MQENIKLLPADFNSFIQKRGRMESRDVGLSDIDGPLTFLRPKNSLETWGRINI